MNAYKVKPVASKRLDTVYADYVRLKSGALVFLCRPPRPGDITILVKCYAADAWLSVENAVKQFRKDNT